LLDHLINFDLQAW